MLTSAFLPAAGGGGAPSVGPGPAMPAAGPVDTTTISPTFQQTLTPQISPTIQVTTDSAGATVVASATQIAPGGQTAAGGGSSPAVGPGAVTQGPAGLPANPLTSPSFFDEFALPVDTVREVMQSRPFDWTPLLWGGALLAAVVLGGQYIRKAA